MGDSFPSRGLLRDHVFYVVPVVLCALLLATSGCVHRGRDSVVHFWGDVNTLNEPAFFVDKIYHQPLKSFTVDRFRWMYDRPPGGPLPGEAPYDLVGHPASAGPGLLPGPAAYPDTIGPRVDEPGSADDVEMTPLPPLPEDAPGDSSTAPAVEQDGPTAQGDPSTEFVSLRRARPPSANTPTSLGSQPPQPSVASPPKGSWLFGGSRPVNR